MSTQIAIKKEEMGLFHSMAVQFAKAGAFPNKSPEQLFVLMKAGQEMGMSEVEALNGLYIIKGKVEPYGKALVSLMTRNGYQMSYEDEDEDNVTVVAKKGDHVIKEHVSSSDPILKRSQAIKISKKHKMRYHGIRMILNFHLAHLISSVSDIDEVYVQDLKDGDYEEVSEATNHESVPEADPVAVKERLINIHDKKQLGEYYSELKAEYVLSVEVDGLFTQRAGEIDKAKKATPKATPKTTPTPPDAAPQGETTTEPEPANDLEPEPKKLDSNVDKEIADQIKAAKVANELNVIYKDISAKGIDPRPYLPLLTKRKKELSNA